MTVSINQPTRKHLYITDKSKAHSSRKQANCSYSLYVVNVKQFNSQKLMHDFLIVGKIQKSLQQLKSPAR